MSRLRLSILIFLIAGNSLTGIAQPAEVTYLDPDNFQIAYQGEVFAILADVSLRKEYRRAHIPGAVHIPSMKKLEVFADTLDREIPVYIYCDGESRSLTVAEYLQEHEFQKLIILRGGMRYWQAAGLPVEGRRKFKKGLN